MSRTRWCRPALEGLRAGFGRELSRGAAGSAARMRSGVQYARVALAANPAAGEGAGLARPSVASAATVAWAAASAPVSLSVLVGLALAVGTAFTSVLGFLYKHRGAVESPPIQRGRPIRSSLVLFRSRAYTLGILIATASWGLHVGALSLA